MNTTNPYAPPTAPVRDIGSPDAQNEPGGRGARLGAVILDGIGKIIADHKAGYVDTIEQQAGEAPIAVIGKIDMPGPLLAGIVRCEAVNGE